MERLSSWDTIDFAAPLSTGLAAPAHHWPAFRRLDVPAPVGVALNHLAMRFSCHMFVFFETFLIRWMELHFDDVAGAIAPEAARRFIEEERAHARAFDALALRFGAAGAGAGGAGGAASPLLWTRFDEWLIRRAPVVTLVALIALFEEMTIPVVDVIDDDPASADPVVREVMHLHARDERSHVGLNLRILKSEAERLSPLLFVPLLYLSLPLMRYVDAKMVGGWTRLVEPFARAHGFTAQQTRAVVDRGMSRSDALGIASFLVKYDKARLPGSGLFRAIIERTTRGPSRRALDAV
jgi:hypothetical protein